MSVTLRYVTLPREPVSEKYIRQITINRDVVAAQVPSRPECPRVTDSLGELAVHYRPSAYGNSQAATEGSPHLISPWAG